MRTIVLLLVSYFVSWNAQSQTIAVEIPGQNKVMLCVPNSLKIAVETKTPKPFFVTTDNGTLTRRDSFSVVYDYLPERTGYAKIYVRQGTSKIPGRILDSSFVKVIRMPLSTPRFAGRSEGEMSQNTIIIGFALSVPVECCGFDAKFPIDGFTISVSRRGKVVFQRDEVGARIDSIAQDFFYQLKDGDTLRFTNVKIKDCDGEVRTTEPIAFSVTDAHEYEDVPVDDIVIIDPITEEEKHLGKGIRKQRKMGSK